MKGNAERLFRAGFRFLLFLLCLVPFEPACAAIADLRKVRPTPGHITACFLSGSPKVQDVIISLANQWSQGTGVRFVFGSGPEGRTCTASMAAEIRIEVSATAGNWSYMGTDSKQIPSGPTMAIQLGSEAQATETYFQYNVLHQFGHALGFLHEEQDPKSRCRADLNMAVVLDRTQWPKSMLHLNVDPVALDDGHFFSSGYDTDSVMRLFVDPEFFLGGAADRCYRPATNKLSVGNLRAAALLYPPRPPEVEGPDSPSDTLTSFSIRLEGPVASEHYGFVLDALYRLRKVQLFKYVTSPGRSNLSDALAERGLLPRNAVSSSLDAFLCSINPNVCRIERHEAKWRTTTPTRNYVDEGMTCPNKRLPRFVICLPNIRLGSYRLISSVYYEPSYGPLRIFVPDKLGGCDSWDDACRTLVKHVNTRLPEGTLLADGDLKPGFVGNIWLPVRAYRIPIHYSDKSERTQIEKAIGDVIASRAKALGVTPDKILISITDPVGAPKPDAGETSPALPPLDLQQAVRRPLQIMGYPDPSTIPGWYGRLRQVQIAIWDRPIQIDHCAFTRNAGASIFLITRWRGSISDTPPDKAGACGQLRDDSYRPKPWFDHGTFVAGILAAELTQNGSTILGAEPWVKIWSWELVSPEQINEQDSPAYIMGLQNIDEPVAINLSQSFPIVPGSRTALEGFFFGSGQSPSLDGDSLIVAPAGGAEDTGSTGRQIGDVPADCNIFPACWSGTNLPARGVISVVALNRDGTDILKGSGDQVLTNYGEAFDVSAVGDVYSTYYGDWVGHGKGSSYAAPYVTALATLLHAKLKGMLLRSPSVLSIKWRILASADPLKELVPSSRFGRINFGRALSFEADTIKRYLTGGDCNGCTLSGALDRNPGDRRISFANSDDILLSRIYRIIRNDDGTVTVYWKRLDAGREILVASRNLTFSNPDDEIRLRARDGTLTVVKLKEIGDFTACAFVSSCSVK